MRTATLSVSWAGPDDLDSDYRAIRNRDNDWMIDRQVQKYETFTGIEGINTQDQAVQESMGGIVDRSTENLSASDMAIVVARRTAAGSSRHGGGRGRPARPFQELLQPSGHRQNSDYGRGLAGSAGRRHVSFRVDAEPQVTNDIGGAELGASCFCNLRSIASRGSSPLTD